eukprot:PhM_4_TR17588/c0_g1_i1/m.14210
MQEAVARVLFPALFLFHGGGPMPLLGDRDHQPLVSAWKDYAASMPRPEAIVVVTAHYEAADDIVSIGAAEKPDMIYDYYGFPAESYKVRYPAPGSPQLAASMKAMLEASNIPARLDKTRGFDHGVFVPLMIMYPDADIPVVPVSILKSQDAAAHLAIGEALAPLRERNILVIGSGAQYHNFGGFFGRVSAQKPSSEFDAALREVLTTDTMTASERHGRLVQWRELPSAAHTQPPGQADHFMPLLVLAGVAQFKPAKKTRSFSIFSGKIASSDFFF